MSFQDRFLRPEFSATTWIFRTEAEEYDEVDTYYYVSEEIITFEGAPNQYDDPWNCYRTDRIEIMQNLYELLLDCEKNKISLENTLFAMKDKEIEPLALAMDWTGVTPILIVERIATIGEGGPDLPTIDMQTKQLRGRYQSLMEPTPDLTLVKSLAAVISSKLAESKTLGKEDILEKMITETEEWNNYKNVLDFVEETKLPITHLYERLLNMHRTAPYQEWCFAPTIPLFQVGRFGIRESFPINGEIVYMTDTETLTAHDIFMRQYPLLDSISDYYTNIAPGVEVYFVSKKLGFLGTMVTAVDGYTLTVEPFREGWPQIYNVFDFRPLDPSDPASKPVYYSHSETYEETPVDRFGFMDVCEFMGDPRMVRFVLGKTSRNNTTFYLLSDNISTTVDDADFDVYNWLPPRWIKHTKLSPGLDKPWERPVETKPPPDKSKPGIITSAVRVPTGVIAALVIGLYVLNDSL